MLIFLLVNMLESQRHNLFKKIQSWLEESFDFYLNVFVAVKWWSKNICVLYPTINFHVFCQVNLVTVGHALIFLGHTSVPVINGLQAPTVRLILMNVAVGTVVVRIWARAFALISMHPASVAMNQSAKDFNVTVRLVFKVLMTERLVIKSNNFLAIHLESAWQLGK